MSHKKLVRFEEIKSFSNVLEYPVNIKNSWPDFFKNNHPLTLELACGKGEYTLGLAKLYKEKNFIGIDIKGNRIWKGASTALSEGLPNVAFIRTQIDKIADYFLPNSIENIWITFPDPQLRNSKAKKRLTHPKFLRQYQQILTPNGKIHLKTDSPDLYQFTKTVINLFELDLLEDVNDVHSLQNITSELKIKTHYESLDIAGSNRIHYLQFKINNPLPIDKDVILKKIINEQSN